MCREHGTNENRVEKRLQRWPGYVGGPQANQVITLLITADPTQGILGQLLCNLTNSLGGTGGLLGQLQGELTQLSATLTSLLSLFGSL